MLPLFIQEELVKMVLAIPGMINLCTLSILRHDQDQRDLAVLQARNQDVLGIGGFRKSK